MRGDCRKLSFLYLRTPFVMKTRIIHTKFWTDPFILGCSVGVRYFFLYLISNSHINISGIYELPDQVILMETGMTPEQLKTAKEFLEDSGKVSFEESWIYVRNAQKHNNYRKSPMNEKAYLKEIQNVPKGILGGWGIDTTIDSSIDTNQKQEIRNKKPEIRDNKLGIRKRKMKIIDQDGKVEEVVW